MGAVDFQKHNSVEPVESIEPVEGNRRKAFKVTQKNNTNQYDDLLRLIACAVGISILPALFINPSIFIGFAIVFGGFGAILYGILRLLGFFKDRGTHPVLIVGIGVLAIFAVVVILANLVDGSNGANIFRPFYSYR